MWNRPWLAAIFLFAFCAAVPVRAATTSTTFTVSATVLSSCTVSASNLAFGSYTPSSGAVLDGMSTLQATCSNGSDYTVALDGGTTGDAAARAMNDGASHDLSYGLYTTAARNTIWGDGTAPTVTQGGTGNGTSQPLTVYGRIPASQFVAPGGYTDTITVTLTY